MKPTRSREIKIAVRGRVLKPNKRKILALNKTLNKYLGLVKWYLSFNSTSKSFLHKHCYRKAKELFNLNPALTQTARDKAVEILKSFKRAQKQARVAKPTVKQISIRFDQRVFSFAKTHNSLTPYWLTIRLDKRISLPIKFGRRQQSFIEEALQGRWKFCVVELVKRSGEWYAHFVLKREAEFKQPETIIGLDLGEWNIATAVAVSPHDSKPMKGRFWSGAEIRKIRGKYGHIRRSLQKKKALKHIKRIGQRESRKVNQIIHTVAKEIVEYAREFKNPIIVMEELTGIRQRMRSSRKLNRRLHAWPFRKLQEYIEYKANLAEIAVRFIKPKNTSKRCHRCGHVAHVDGREFRCPKCGLVYNRDLNAAINIAHVLMRGMGWGSSGSPELPDEVLM
ncbi:MAG: hypothetical protein QIT35_gp92 [Methanophagales virus PBV299]|uniref:Cas12f1-like TNB domain-containing protein n=1 Tax=Methanophagales virus PBV299 TaxID=2987730 RepID=A0ABY6GLL2_9CAUD|nr:MAG: hypothetical protein QIT35_gp92 [Methanophagales virus PBV299]UYL64888.1 MAG: hypothetical protein OFDIEDLO_00092 [Methanophagales virus PBV299]